MRKILSIALLMSSTALAENAPFGIAKNTTVQQLIQMGAQDRGNGMYILNNVPLANKNFDHYMVIASPTQGVCKVVGIGRPNINDSNGNQARKIYNEMKGYLITKYGNSNEYDSVKYSSIWSSPSDFAISLKNGDRNLTSFWPSNKGIVLPGGIQGIMLDVTALDYRTTLVALGYEYTNFDKCWAEIKGDIGRGL